MRALAIALAILGGLAAPARAHQSSIKYVDIAASDRTALVRFTVAPSDVTSPLGLQADVIPAIADAIHAPAVPPYIAAWVTFEGCTPSSAEATADPDGKFIVVTWKISCPQPIATLRADFTGFFTVDHKHQAIVTLHTGDDPGEPAIVRDAQPLIELHAGERPSTFQWIRYGMDHIYSGRDHICFVLALLLVVALARSAEDRREWTTRAPQDAIKRTAKIITAFTIAHSCSLIAASLGYVHLPSMFVESMIAISIAYTAIEDILKPDVRWRFVLTFGFGLIHGLGFASALEELLPPDHVIVPLLAFNVGVELGQLSIVLVALPVLWLIARELGATRYRRTVMPVLATIIFGFGMIWLVERLSGLTILGL